MFAIGNEELAMKRDIGKTIKCKICNGTHDIQYGDEILKDGTKIKSKLLAYYKCGNESYLAGIDGKLI